MALLSAQAKDLPHGLPGHRAALPLGQRQREGAVLLHRGLPRHHQELGEKGRARPGGERGFPPRHAGDGGEHSAVYPQRPAAGGLSGPAGPDGGACPPGGAAVRRHRQRQDPGLSPPDPEGPGGWTGGHRHGPRDRPDPQLTANLLGPFRHGRSPCFHSCLPTGERYDEWKRVRDGRAKVVVGTRSAVFAPLPDLGLIILDEEQESSYQSESMVRYHAREVAKFRCKQHKGLLLLGSATPAVESRYAAETGQYHLFTLQQRYNAHQLPKVVLADMKQELRAGNNSGVSRAAPDGAGGKPAAGRAEHPLSQPPGQQPHVPCAASAARCPTCPRCSVHLTYHSANGRLMCHYCGYSMPLPPVCPALRRAGSSSWAWAPKSSRRSCRALYPDVEVHADGRRHRHGHPIP